MPSTSPALVVDPLAFSLRALGGVARVWRNLLPHLVDSDIDVRFTCGVDGKEALKNGLDAAIESFDRAHRIPARWRRFVPYTGPAALFFPTYFRPCRGGIPNIQLVHDCMKELYYPIAKAALARARKRRIYRDATALIAISEATRLELLRLHGESLDGRIRVIHNPVDHGYLVKCSTAGESAVEFEETIGRLGGRPFALFIGHRAAWKNFREAKHLSRALPEHVLLAVGAQPSAAEQQFASTCEGRIIFTGPLRDEVMFALLKRAQFLFFPSMLEGFGLPIVESLLLGTPVLALETQVNREVSLGQVTTFETGAPASIRAAAGRLQRIEIGGAIHRRLAEQFDPRTIAHSYLAVIREFI